MHKIQFCSLIYMTIENHEGMFTINPNYYKSILKPCPR